MKILLLIGVITIIVLLIILLTRAIRIYKSMKSIEKNIILEVSNTKKTFQDLVADLFEEEKPRRDVTERRNIDAEEE